MQPWKWNFIFISTHPVDKTGLELKEICMPLPPRSWELDGTTPLWKLFQLFTTYKHKKLRKSTSCPTGQWTMLIILASDLKEQENTELSWTQHHVAGVFLEEATCPYKESRPWCLNHHWGSRKSWDRKWLFIPCRTWVRNHEMKALSAGTRNLESSDNVTRLVRQNFTGPCYLLAPLLAQILNQRDSY